MQRETPFLRVGRLSPLLLSLLLGALPLLTVSCSRSKPITNGAWSFDEKKGTLLCSGIAVPASLANHQLWLFTPLGTFVPQSDGKWFRKGWRIPLPDASQRWVSSQFQCGETGFTSDHAKVGYYVTHSLGYGPACWQDAQITGTPPSWIYAFRVRDGKERGAWIAPEKLGEVNWAEILEKTETAQLDLK